MSAGRKRRRKERRSKRWKAPCSGLEKTIKREEFAQEEEKKLAQSSSKSNGNGSVAVADKWDGILYPVGGSTENHHAAGNGAAKGAVCPGLVDATEAGATRKNHR